MTDAEGWITFTGFRGNYTLQTDKGSGSITLDRDLESRIDLSN